jgi:hypothetical protein
MRRHARNCAFVTRLKKGLLLIPKYSIFCSSIKDWQWEVLGFRAEVEACVDIIA